MDIKRCVAFIEIAATWTLAVALVTVPHSPCQLIGWLILAGKGVSVITTLASLLRRPVLGWRILRGRYIFDTGKIGWRQALLRFSWESPQMLLGYAVAQIRNTMGQVDRVEYLGGVTFVVAQGRRDGICTGMSLGNIVNLWLSGWMSHDFEYDTKYSFGQILMHEYGHTIDSARLGWLYLPAVGLPSLVSLWLQNVSTHRHKDLYAERWANKHAQDYFGVPIRDLSNTDFS